MAQKVIVELVDDIDGRPIPEGQGETIEFAIDGIGYSIDLGPKNAKAFRKSLDRYVEHATRTGGRRRTHTTRPDPILGVTAATSRESSECPHTLDSGRATVGSGRPFAVEAEG